jgi:hypothetical protein
MTITITDIDSPITERVLKFLRREKVPFVLQQDEEIDDLQRIEAIRERLRLKYVVNGQWATMTDDDRQDAALLEGMLYDDENDNVELLSTTEQIEFKNEMKSWAR